MQDDPADVRDAEAGQFRRHIAGQPEPALATEPTGPVRARLRHATADIHENLHQHPAFTRLMAGILTMPEYSALLGRLYGFHWPLEISLRAVSGRQLGEPVGPIDPATRKTALLLHADLLHLGVSQPEIDAIPLCDALPAIASPEEVVGCLYVIEGSGLGGKVMARKLDRLLGAHDRAGRQFLMGQAEADPLHWPLFCRWLEAWAAGRDLVAITRSARRTFESMETWLRSGDDNV
jgi:heme oxygenase (biliverdin-IX-beta and delta-forming)